MPLVPTIDQSDGVLTVHYKSSDGRTAPVADFWIKPLMDGLGMSRADATEWQRQFAGLLVSAYAQHFSEPLCKPSDNSGQITGDKDLATQVERPQRNDLWIANAIRDEINEILARYDVHSDVYDRDVRIDAACVMLADRVLSRIATGNLVSPWKCPIGDPNCRQNCGNYGCGN